MLQRLLLNAVNLLIDRIRGSVLACSMRKVRSAYTGPCVRIRRGSDNAVADFGFSGNWVDRSAISAWLAGSDGFIHTWYDQSGRSRNLVQETDANQPTFVYSLQSINAAWPDRPGIAFAAASSQYLRALFTTIAHPLSRLIVARAQNVAAARVLCDGAGGTACLIQATTTNFVVNSGAALNIAASDLSPHQFSVMNNGDNTIGRIDGTQVLGAAGSNALQSGITVGANRSGASFWQGEIAEVLLYDSNISSAFVSAEVDQRQAFATPTA